MAHSEEAASRKKAIQNCVLPELKEPAGPLEPKYLKTKIKDDEDEVYDVCHETDEEDNESGEDAEKRR